VICDCVDDVAAIVASGNDSLSIMMLGCSLEELWTADNVC